MKQEPMSDETDRIAAMLMDATAYNVRQSMDRIGPDPKERIAFSLVFCAGVMSRTVEFIMQHVDNDAGGKPLTSGEMFDAIVELAKKSLEDGAAERKAEDGARH